jgi:hypothetical protein
VDELPPEGAHTGAGCKVRGGGRKRPRGKRSGVEALGSCRRAELDEVRA